MLFPWWVEAEEFVIARGKHWWSQHPLHAFHKPPKWLPCKKTKRSVSSSGDKCNEAQGHVDIKTTQVLRLSFPIKVGIKLILGPSKSLLFFGHFYLLRDFLRARAFHFKPKSRALTSLALSSSGMLEMLENEPSEERSNFLTTKSWRFSREWLRKRWKGRELEALEAPFLLAFKFQQDWLRPFN